MSMNIGKKPEASISVVNPSDDGSNRRAAERVPAEINTVWQMPTGKHEGVLVDISKTGCLVVTTEGAKPGSLVKVEISLPGVFHMTVRGTVARNQEDSGVGVQFRNLTTTEEALLERLIKHLKIRTAYQD